MLIFNEVKSKFASPCNDIESIELAKLHAPQAIISKGAVLEYPVRVFAFAGIQSGAEIGRYTYINRHSFIGKSVRMGRFCSIARNVDVGAENHPMDFLSTHPFQYSNHHFNAEKSYTSFPRHLTSPVPETEIGHDVWVGSSSVISAGIKIGTGAVIGANSFVNEDVPPYAIVAGSPAKVLRYRFTPETIKSLLASKWWDLLPEEMADVNLAQIDQALDQIKKIHAEKLRLEKQPKKKPAKNKEPANEPSSNAAEKLNKILDSALSEKAQKKSKQIEQPENGLLAEHLERFFLELDVPADIAKVVHQRIFTGVLASLDLLKPNDQEILRNKLEFLSELIRGRDPTAITAAETKKIEQIFGQIR